MNVKSFVKKLLPMRRGRGAAPDVHLNLHLLAAARSLAARGDHRVISPCDPARPRAKPIEQLRVCFFGNVANNAYTFVKSLRRLGYQADILIENGSIDGHLLNRPFWEDVSVECASYEEGLRSEPSWQRPAFVKHVSYDHDLQAKYQNRFSAVPEVQALYYQTFGKAIPDDAALLLAQNMGHWPALCILADYDVAQLSMCSLYLGSFCPRPYVAFPAGGDLYMLPFEETIYGLLVRAAYRAAGFIHVAGTDCPAYVRRFVTHVPLRFLPFMLDTDTYRPGDQPEIRRNWNALVGGSRFLFSACRQNWEWKGNDLLIRAFARFVAEGHDEWRLIFQEWGTDIDRSKALIHEVGLDDRVAWQPLCSKALLRCRQQASDAVADQFVMDGYGAAVLEAMAAGKPVLATPPAAHAYEHLGEPPPFVGARCEDEILAGLRLIADDEARRSRGNQTRNWAVTHHGYLTLGSRYMEVFRDAFESQLRL